MKKMVLLLEPARISCYNVYRYTDSSRNNTYGIFLYDYILL